MAAMFFNEDVNDLSPLAGIWQNSFLGRRRHQGRSYLKSHALFLPVGFSEAANGSGSGRLSGAGTVRAHTTDATACLIPLRGGLLLVRSNVGPGFLRTTLGGLWALSASWQAGPRCALCRTQPDALPQWQPSRSNDLSRAAGMLCGPAYSNAGFPSKAWHANKAPPGAAS